MNFLVCKLYDSGLGATGARPQQEVFILIEDIVAIVGNRWGKGSVIRTKYAQVFFEVQEEPNEIAALLKKALRS